MLFVVAAGAAVVYGRVQSGADAREAAQADARFAARLAAREIGDGIEVLQQTVAGAAANPGIAKAFARPEDCGLSFGGTDAYTTGHLDLVRDGRLGGVLVDEGGRRPRLRGRRLARQARCASRGLSAPVADPRTGKQVVLATAPVPKARARAGLVQPRRRRAQPARQLRRPARARVRARRQAGQDRPHALDRPRALDRRARSRSTATSALYASATVTGVGWQRPRRRRPRAGARRHARAQPPRGDDHPRRAAAVPAGDGDRAPARGAPAGAARTARCAARRPTARRRR